MQIPEFITKALSFFTTAEDKLNKLTAAEQSLTEARARVTKLETDVAAAQVALATAQTALTAEQATVATMKTELDAAKATIADPKGEIQRLAAVKANEIAAKMGAPPLKAEDHTKAANDGKTLLDQYLELNATNPKAAAKFAAEHGGAMALLGEK